MADIFSKNKRSEIMSLIRGKDSKIEIQLRKGLWKHGYRYRKNVSGYFGKPDILLKKYKTAIFVDSCFWHGCKRHFKLPTSRKGFWGRKIERNIQRDSEVNRHYRGTGWHVIRIWEHEIGKNPQKSIDKILKVLEKYK